MESPIYWYRNPIQEPRSETQDPRFFILLVMWLSTLVVQAVLYWHVLPLLLKVTLGGGVALLSLGLLNLQTLGRYSTRNKVINLEIHPAVLIYENERVSYRLEFSTVVEMNFYPFLPDGSFGYLTVDTATERTHYPIYLTGDARWVLGRMLGERFREKRWIWFLAVTVSLVVVLTLRHAPEASRFLKYSCWIALVMILFRHQFGKASRVVTVHDDELAVARRNTGVMIGLGSFFLGWFMSMID